MDALNGRSGFKQGFDRLSKVGEVDPRVPAEFLSRSRKIDVENLVAMLEKFLHARTAHLAATSCNNHTCHIIRFLNRLYITRPGMAIVSPHAGKDAAEWDRVSRISRKLEPSGNYPAISVSPYE
jgi:hypothetical protein